MTRTEFSNTVKRLECHLRSIPLNHPLIEDASAKRLFAMARQLTDIRAGFMATPMPSTITTKEN